jgi:hypothetical protein
VNQLSVLVTFSGDGVNDGVQLDSSVGDLSCEVRHVVMDADVRFVWMPVDMVCVVRWQALSSIASA